MILSSLFSLGTLAVGLAAGIPGPASVSADLCPLPASDEAVEGPEGSRTPPTDGTERVGPGPDSPTPGREGHAHAGRPSRELYCVDLLPTPRAPDAEGVAELTPPPSPFGVRVNRDGVHLYDFHIRTRGLPPPNELGDEYTTYVAWLSTPNFAVTRRLGEISDDAPLVERAGLNTFLLIVSAEPHGDVEDRTGPVVLRGTSASMVLRPHDVELILGEMLGPGPGHEGHGEHPQAEEPLPDLEEVREPDPRRAHHDVDDPGRAADHDPPAVEAPEPGGMVEWFPPPMHPRVRMPMGMMTLRPSLDPFLPTPPSDEAIPQVKPTEEVRVNDGDTVRLTAGPVRREIDGRSFVMYGFNEQVPGPRLRSPEGATVFLEVENRTELPSTVHWHGIRLDNRFDGVPGVTQDPIEPGERFLYQVELRDPGTYWYHPHVREDIKQDLGLYGNLYVEAADPQHLGPVDREEFVVLDDLLLGARGLLPYGRQGAIHAIMGRFGNTLLTNGTPGYDLRVQPGQVVRFHLTNVANTRTFNLSFSGPDGAEAPMKVVASDVGRFQREERVESVVISPAERYVVDVHFPQEGPWTMENRVQGLNHLAAEFFTEVDTLGTVEARGGTVHGGPGDDFHRTRSFPEVSSEMDEYREAMEGPVDHRLVLTLDLSPGSLPFPLGPMIRFESVYNHPVEWVGTMPDMDWLAGADVARWVLRDPEAGAENMAIDWSFEKGDVVKLQVTNDADSFHPMQHPIHIHGQRFLVLSRNGTPQENLVWKDTVLIPVGETVELLLEASNPGAWMIHCHIAEHLESGMMMLFHVHDRNDGDEP